jgi:hypothetical protein
MAGQTDLKTLMEFSGHTQVSTVIGNYVFATSESMKNAINGMDKLRPTSKMPPRRAISHKILNNLYFVTR